MGNFYFKKFSVRQTDSAMKVNTDGVLLSAWVSLPEIISDSTSPFYLLDIGTGTGVIALVMAQRLSEEQKRPFKITALDIDLKSAAEASFNFSQSIWKDNMDSLNISLQNFSPKTQFSLILSNPPFFTDSLKAPSERRSIARDNYKLPADAIMEFSSQHLLPKGVLGLILPVSGSTAVIKEGEKRGLFLRKRCYVKTVASKEPKRVLLEFCKDEKEKLYEEVLIMQQSGGDTYSKEYRNIVERFYMKNLK